MALSEKQIRERILSIIWEIAPDSKKIRRNNLKTNDRSKWAGLLYTDPTDESITPIAHAYIVRRTKRKSTVESRDDVLTFEILGFRSYSLGTDNANSEDIFQAEIDAIADRLMDKERESPAWEFENEPDEVSTVEVDFSSIGLIESSELLHFGGGSLVLRIQRC